MNNPMVQKITVGAIVALLGAGIAATSNMIVKTVETSARIEAKVEDISTDFDRFVDLRYQADMDRIGTEMARVEDRIDQAIMGTIAP